MFSREPAAQQFSVRETVRLRRSPAMSNISIDQNFHIAHRQCTEGLDADVQVCTLAFRSCDRCSRRFVVDFRINELLQESFIVLLAQGAALLSISGQQSVRNAHPGLRIVQPGRYSAAESGSSCSQQGVFCAYQRI